LRTNSKYFLNITTEILNAYNAVVMCSSVAPCRLLFRTQTLKPLHNSEIYFFPLYQTLSIFIRQHTFRLLHGPCTPLQVRPLPSLHNGKANRNQHCHLLRSSYTGSEWRKAVMFVRQFFRSWMITLHFALINVCDF
jgi:hypothetical protein